MPGVRIGELFSRAAVALASLLAAAPAGAVALGGAALGSPVECGAVLMHDTVLTADLTGCAGDGLVIGASGITLDLAGHTISGSGAAGSVGIENVGFDRVRIVNGSVRAFDIGVALKGGADRNRLRGLSADGGSEGIRISDSHGNRVVEGSFAGAGGHGIAIRDSARNLLGGNSATGNGGYGIALFGSHRNRISANTTSANLLGGIFVAAGSRRNRLSRNVASHNRDDGIHVDDPATTILRNIADDNDDLGIEAVPGVVARGNRAQGNGNPVQCLNADCAVAIPPPPANELDNPHGLAVDAGARTVVAESGANRVSVFDRDGAGLTTFGRAGAGNGEFNAPWDVAVDPAGGINVVDRGNGRIQVLDAGGAFLRQFGTPGSGPGRLNQPQGIAIDGSGRIYVADTGNQRVQRFRGDGTLDTTWGSGGIVGTTGTVKRDHTGFDGPADVAVNPVTGHIYVADHGNARLEVLDDRGRYVRTYLAVYRSNGLAFDQAGNLYIAGEDPNENYKAFDGRLRVLRAGDELIGRHYTGGLDDIGRVEGGVAIRPDGKIVFTDVFNGRVVRIDSSLTVPVSGLQIDAKGTTLTFRWKTARAGPGSVRFGPRPTDTTVVTDPTVGTSHEVALTGLSPNTRLVYGVSFPDSFDGARRFTPTDVLNTGAPPGQTQFLRLKAAGVIYTDIQAGPGYTKMDAATLAAARTRLRRVADFYWRNSGFRLWPDIQVIEVDRDVTTPLDLFSSMESDLGALGFGAADDFDAAWGTSDFAIGNFGTGGFLFGRFVGLSQWATQDDFPAIHEVHHSIDTIYDFNDLRKYEFNHGIWAIPGGLGRDFAINAQIVRNMLPVNFTAVRPPFAKILTAPDADDDSVPDSSPAGLSVPLSITEATLGSSIATADTDGDGVSDLNEAMALPFHNTDPTATDSDGDGTPDGADPNPAYRMTDRIAKGTPVIDGVIASGEPWTAMTDGSGFSNDALVPDNDALQSQVTTYAAWDDRYLYLALKGPATVTQVRLDGNADNLFFGPDNYWLTLASGFFSKEVRINVGVPDLFRQIDDDGQFSEFFDTDPRFTLLYNGTPFTQPGEGAGFPGRLVTEDDLVYQPGGSGSASVWEVALPWSVATQLQGFDGKEMAIAFEVGGDLLFETDHTARIRLVGSPT